MAWEKGEQGAVGSGSWQLAVSRKRIRDETEEEALASRSDEDGSMGEIIKLNALTMPSGERTFLVVDKKVIREAKLN